MRSDDIANSIDLRPRRRELDLLQLRYVVSESLAKHRPDLDRLIAWERRRLEIVREGRVAMTALFVIAAAIAFGAWLGGWQ